jgi:hypothetical protein
MPLSLHAYQARYGSNLQHTLALRNGESSALKPPNIAAPLPP